MEEILFLTIITSNLVFWVLKMAGESWKFVYCPLRTKNQRMFLHQNSLDRDIMLLVHFMTFLCLLPCRMLMEKKERRSNSEGVYIIKRSSRLIHHTQRVLRRRKEIKFVTRICLCTLKARLRGIEKCFSTFGENAKWNSSWGDVQLSLRTLVLHTYYNIKEQYHGK